MDQLWAPWRLAFVTAAKTPGAMEECFLCRGLAEREDRRNLIALRTPYSVMVLNRFPYNNGHLLVAPAAHKSHPGDLDAAETLDVMQTVNRAIALLDELMHPDGYNLGVNLGAAAGAGLPGHLHWHVVPRWNGDTNFMPVLTDTKVIVQSLDTLYDLLVARMAHDE